MPPFDDAVDFENDYGFNKNKPVSNNYNQESLRMPD